MTRAASSLVDRVGAFCASHSLLAAGDSVVIGVSGGPDSLALLHILRNLAPRLNLTLIAAHLNHQLRGADADADAEFVQAVAQSWDIAAVIETQNVAALAAQRQLSIEEAARQVRYAFLWRLARQSGSAKIAVGHNADDQVETVLMHFLRGSGLLGLRGILPAINIAGLRLPSQDIPAADEAAAPLLIRPLLDTPRAEIDAYCRQHQLTPRQDQTNLDTSYFRNRLRHELIPYLETFNPNLRPVLRRTARVVTADAEFLQQQLQTVWPSLIQSESVAHLTFDLPAWQRLPLALQRSALRRAVEQLRRGLRDIGFDHIESAVELLAAGQTGTQVTLPQLLVLTIGYGSFTLASLDNPPQPDIPLIDCPLRLNVPGETQLPASRWRVVARLCPPQANIHPADPWEAFLDASAVDQPLSLRPRQPGDLFCPLGMPGRHKKINEFMINEKIPAGWRNQIPLLVAGQRVLWVCGYRPDDQAKVRPDTKQILHIKFE